MYFNFQRDLAAFLQSEYGVQGLDIPAELCPPEFSGELSISCFVLARQLKRNPMQLAAQVGEFLRSHADILSLEVVKAFVNISLAPGALMRDCVADAAALQARSRLEPAERQRILIEFSAPNTNKPQHLGHVRNNCIGMASASILARVGHDVVRVNLVNDRGIHICKSMLAYQRFGDDCSPETLGKKGDHLVGDFYVRFDQELRKQIEELRQNDESLREKDSDELFLQTEIGRAAQEMLLKWEQGDEEVRALWEKMNQWVFDGFEQTYKRMGVEFEHTYLESQTYMLGRDIIMEGLQRGVFYQRQDGALVIDFDDPRLGSKVVLRSDGTSVYITQDIGTTLLKQNDYQPEQQIWVVGDEQKYHFQVLFAILKALGYEWAERLTHMSYGMVNLPSGRMKSREGTVVDADELFDLLEQLAGEATAERNQQLEPDELQRRAQSISMAALKFMLLKVNPKTTLLFDPQASIKFEGDTGPYILYAYARIASMLRRAKEELKEEQAALDWSLLDSASEKRLALRCAMYPAALHKAAAELDSSVLAAYLLDLAKDFSSFYKQCSVLNAENPTLRQTRLELSERVREIIGDGLRTLTIEPLESM
ncbi:MAG: arginine--tRNA ligase [Lentisphaerae bacterium]|nr:arginine--tRNA ligase [Lentisphaerota bacterium]